MVLEFFYEILLKEKIAGQKSDHTTRVSHGFFLALETNTN
jgi:hypothetical protein